jgi:hypothetical protein
MRSWPRQRMVSHRWQRSFGRWRQRDAPALPLIIRERSHIVPALAFKIAPARSPKERSMSVREHQTRAHAISLRLRAEAEQRTVNAESRLTAAKLAINRQRHRLLRHLQIERPAVAFHGRSGGRSFDI